MLGSGLGGLADQLDNADVVPFADLPGWPDASAPGHTGRLLLGDLDGVSVVCLQGRLHMYEGLSERLVVEPVLLMGRLGARAVLVTNAAGGVNAAYPAGTLMVIADHLNLTGRNPLIGPNDDALGARFPDMSVPYDAALRAIARDVATARGIALREGTYVAVPGPNLETRAEYRMLRALGGDVVGMSTVPEVTVARHAGMRVLGLSIITDQCLPDALEPATLERIIAVANGAEPGLTRLVRGVLERL